MKKSLHKISSTSLLLVMVAFCLTGCEKLIEVDVPVNQLTTGAIYSDSVTAQATVNGMYSAMYNTTGGGTVTASTFGTFVINCPARSADESYWPNSPNDELVNNSLVPTSADVTTLWVNPYSNIYQANKIIEGMQASALSESLKRQLIGEAKFIRAYCYYTLVNFFGDVPLVTTTNVQVNLSLGRTPVNEVYNQMISDLKDAQAVLASDYSWSAGLRTRANKWAATAMLARVYLYRKQYALAEAESSKVIANQPTFSLPALSQTFLKASPETIWAFNTNQFGYPFIARALLPSSSGEPSQPLTPNLVAAFERDPVRQDYEDDRFAAWVKTSPTGRAYAVKYVSNVAGANTEFAVVLRLAEQYLIRAEARAQLNDLTGAIADINRIRTRAGLRNTPAATKNDLLLAIEHERQIELFMEYGHRWFDLKRTGRATAVLSPIKGSNWQETDVLYPIPQAQIINNSNLVQNLGY
jgi:starch-binding outer membrane protein, SusD/RagB family